MMAPRVAGHPESRDPVGRIADRGNPKNRAPRRRLFPLEHKDKSKRKEDKDKRREREKHKDRDKVAVVAERRSPGAESAGNL